MHAFTARTRRRTALVAAVAAVAIGGGIGAYAYWTATGTGQGTATTGAAENFRIFASDPEGAPLTPGGPTQTVAFRVQNPATGTQRLSNISVYIANPDGSQWTAVEGCSAADYTVGAVTVPYGDIAGGDEVDGSVSISMINTATNQDACQGATVPLYFTTALLT